MRICRQRVNLGIITNTIAPSCNGDDLVVDHLWSWGCVWTYRGNECLRSKHLTCCKGKLLKILSFQLAYILPPLCYMKLSTRSWRTLPAILSVVFGVSTSHANSSHSRRNKHICDWLASRSRWWSSAWFRHSQRWLEMKAALTPVDRAWYSLRNRLRASGDLRGQVPFRLQRRRAVFSFSTDPKTSSSRSAHIHRPAPTYLLSPRTLNPALVGRSKARDSSAHLCFGYFRWKN